MSETIILKLICAAFVTFLFSLNAKIIWDWMKNKKTPEKKIDQIIKILTGNGSPEDSIVFRLAQIELFIKELKKK